MDNCWHIVAIFVLQQACGFEYTSKLQRMFQDIGVSKDLNEQFKKHLHESAQEPLDSQSLFSWFSSFIIIIIIILYASSL